MVEPFGGQEKDEGLSRRPAQTIEGTATEVAVEPLAGEEAVAEEASSPEPSPKETGSSDGPADEAAAGDAAPADTGPVRKSQPPRTSPAELKGFVTHLAAGLLGGLVGVVALAFAWGLPDRKAETPNLATVEQRLAKLESEPAPAPDTKALAALDQRVKALETRKLEPQQDLSEVMTRVSKLQASLDALAKAASEGGSVPDAAALDAMMGEIERRLDDKIAAGLSAQDAAQGKSFETVQAELAQLKAKLGALAEAKLDAAETDLSPEVAALDERITKLETTLPSLAGAIDRGTATARSGAAAIAFANLREAVDDGRAYAAELSAFTALAPKLGDLSVLPSRADTGIPTVPALAEDLRAQAQAAEGAAQAVADASFIDSVIASAKSAVRIRRVDETATGSEPDAVLARAEAALAKGDLAGAVKEVEALPGASRAALAPWLDNAQARLSADETLAKLQATLVSSLGGKTGEAKPATP